MKKKGFTLAEVLITLGIIGIIASLTLPQVIVNYQKKATANKLKKFYTIMSQALMRWETDEGLEPRDFYIDSNAIRNGKELEKWYKSSIGKYIKTLRTASTNDGFSVAFSDGSGFDAYSPDIQRVFFFYCDEYKYCNGGKRIEGNFDGRHGFLFTIDKGILYTSLESSSRLTREQLLNGCKFGNYDKPDESSKDRRHTCTRLIQYDGWEIKDDYPWKQTFLEKK